MKLRRVLPAIGIVMLVAALLVPGVVLASPATATRSFSDSTVDAGDSIVVSMTASAYGTFGQVVETLPAGFSYVSSSLPSGQVTEVAGNKVKFTLLGDASFTYTVTAASTAGVYTFSGIIKDMDLVEFAVTGDTQVTVGAAGATATRTLPTAAVAPGANFTVSIAAADYGTFGQVVETLPSGFSYVSSSLPSGQIEEVAGNKVKFTLLGDASFTYTVTASSTAGVYTFSGIIKDMDLVEVAVTGDTTVTVGVAGATATRTLPTADVEPGANFTVSIAASGYGTFGQVVETLPAGFSYVSSSLPSGQIEEVAGNKVKFTLLGDASFTYTVTASTVEGTYTFSGIIKDIDMNEFAVGGDTAITVEEEVAPAEYATFADWINAIFV